MPNVHAATVAPKNPVNTTARIIRIDAGPDDFQQALLLAKPKPQADDPAQPKQLQAAPKNETHPTDKARAKKAGRGERGQKTETTPRQNTPDASAGDQPVPSDDLIEPANTQATPPPNQHNDPLDTQTTANPDVLCVDNAPPVFQETPPNPEPENKTENTNDQTNQPPPQPHVPPAQVTTTTPPQTHTVNDNTPTPTSPHHDPAPTRSPSPPPSEPLAAESNPEQTPTSTADPQPHTPPPTRTASAQNPANPNPARPQKTAEPEKTPFRIDELPTTLRGADPQIGRQVDAPPTPTATSPQPPADAPFAQTNHPNIVSEIRTNLLPGGGTMRIRLDPPELGTLQITVQIRDGVITASFATSNDEATRLLSHSLHQLKQSLEGQGINVEKLHVEQTTQHKAANSAGDENQQRQPDDHGARHEQQRREMLHRMWRRLRGGSDSVDLTA